MLQERFLKEFSADFFKGAGSSEEAIQEMCRLGCEFCREIKCNMQQRIFNLTPSWLSYKLIERPSYFSMN